MYGDSSSSGGAKPAGPGSGSGGSTYLRNLGLPAQASILVGDLVVCANFVVALLVPWVEARYRVANVWFPVYVPIKIGLLKCFGDVCSILMGGGDPQEGGNGGHSKHKGGGGGNDSPPPIPGWGPPPMSGGNGGGGGGGGGGAKALFEVSAVFAVILLSASVLCALGSAMLEFARMQGRHDVTGLLPLQMAAGASLLCLLAVLQYLFITLAGLHGGHYVVGFWLSLGTAVLTAVLALGQYLMNRSYYAETDGGSAGLFLPSHLKQTEGGGGRGYGVVGGGGGAGQRGGAYGSLGNSS